MAASVTFTLRRNGSVSPRAPSRVRWGRIEVCTAWNSCSGARAISSTLKVKPASAAPSAPSVAFTSSGPALRKVCSASMISEHRHREAGAVGERELGLAPSSSAALGASAPPLGHLGPGRRPSAHGTTASDTIGAAAMPSATTDWPEAIPTATASANSTREHASISTSPP